MTIAIVELIKSELELDSVSAALVGDRDTTTDVLIASELELDGCTGAVPV